MTTGRVVRFDEARGYGFVAPDGDAEDVFLHANDLLIPEEVVRPGLAVEFEIEEGGRGPKASNVRLPGRDVKDVIAARSAPFVAPAPSTAPAPAAAPSPNPDAWDALTPEEFSAHVTEALLAVTPPLQGDQILDARRRLIALAQEQEWFGA